MNSNGNGFIGSKLIKYKGIGPKKQTNKTSIVIMDRAPCNSPSFTFIDTPNKNPRIGEISKTIQVKTFSLIMA